MSDQTVNGAARIRVARNRRYKNSRVLDAGLAGAIASCPELFTLRPGRAFNKVRALERTPTAPYLPTAVGGSESVRTRPQASGE